MATVNLEHLVKRRRLWVVRVRVPEDAKPALGRSVFSWSTGERDHHRAAVKAAPVVAKWKAEIEAARKGTLTPLQREKRALAAAFRREVSSGGDNADLAADAILAFVRKHYARKLDPEALERAVEEHGGDEGAALAALIPEAGPVLDELLASTTPFLEHFDDWAAGLKMGTRQAGEYTAGVKRFGAGKTLETLTAAAVQSWVDGLVKSGDAPATTRRRLAMVRNYWGWLQSHGHVGEEVNPFLKRRIPKAAPGAAVKRQAFKAAEVVALHAEALQRRDQPLADLIALAAFTGGRIEELCSATVAHVVWAGEDGKATLALNSKTEAGNRVLPIPPALEPVVKRLVGAAQGKGRWLVHSTAENASEERSPPLGKRFGRLKVAEGYGPAHVFHSIRKTLATLLQEVECPENIAANIVGHEIETMTYGVYAASTSTAKQREWLEKAVALYPFPESTLA